MSKRITSTFEAILPSIPSSTLPTIHHSHPSTVPTITITPPLYRHRVRASDPPRARAPLDLSPTISMRAKRRRQGPEGDASALLHCRHQDSKRDKASRQLSPRERARAPEPSVGWGAGPRRVGAVSYRPVRGGTSGHTASVVTPSCRGPRLAFDTVQLGELVGPRLFARRISAPSSRILPRERGTFSSRMLHVSCRLIGFGLAVRDGDEGEEAVQAGADPARRPDLAVDDPPGVGDPVRLRTLRGRPFPAAASRRRRGRRSR